MKLVVPCSFDLGSDRSAAAGCITGVLRRILCRSLRERSYRDEDKEVGTTRNDRPPTKQGKSEVAAASRANPGIVARLMGLETSAALPFSQPEMISRTRSANSAETSKGAGLLSEQRSRDGVSQLRKSQSFHEIPSYLRKESEEFLVLTFGDYDDSEGSELSSKKLDFVIEMNNMGESRERKMTEKRPGNRMLENDAMSDQIDTAKSFDSPLAEKAIELNEMAVRSRKKLCFTHGEMETECSSQNSSPVSVFDLPLQPDTECHIVPDSSFSESQKILLEVEKERKKSKRSELVAQDLPDILKRICKLGEEDLIKDSWITKKMNKYEEAEELGYVIGYGLLDILLHEAVVDMWYQ